MSLMSYGGLLAFQLLLLFPSDARINWYPSRLTLARLHLVHRLVVHVHIAGVLVHCAQLRLCVSLPMARGVSLSMAGRRRTSTMSASTTTMSSTTAAMASTTS